MLIFVPASGRPLSFATRSVRKFRSNCDSLPITLAATTAIFAAARGSICRRMTKFNVRWTNRSTFVAGMRAPRSGRSTTTSRRLPSAGVIGRHDTDVRKQSRRKIGKQVVRRRVPHQQPVARANDVAAKAIFVVGDAFLPKHVERGEQVGAAASQIVAAAAHPNAADDRVQLAGGDRGLGQRRVLVGKRILRQAKRPQRFGRGDYDFRASVRHADDLGDGRETPPRSRNGRSTEGWRA